MEGKEPPIYREVGNNIELTFIFSPFKNGFKLIVEALINERKQIDVDHLLITKGHLIMQSLVESLCTLPNLFVVVPHQFC